MNIYTVHELPGAPLDGAGLVLVKEGFSFPAFVFSWMWLLWHRLWVALGLWLGLTVLVSLIADFLYGAGAAAICSLALQLVLGFEANDIRRWTLARRGYRFAGITGGATIEDAERLFFGKWDRPLDAARLTPAVAPVWPRRVSATGVRPEIFGLFPDAGPKREA
ncbi:MAG: DUF2628 domain-containing protein [Parvibaculum sp.]|nr:DUF2628 domain-containing protein [Parvibaculum sp.]